MRLQVAFYINVVPRRRLLETLDSAYAESNLFFYWISLPNALWLEQFYWAILTAFVSLSGAIPRYMLYKGRGAIHKRRHMIIWQS